MNAALRKEVRLLMPAWIAALAGSTIPVWMVGGGPFQGMMAVSLVLYAAGAVLLSLTSFGLEISLGTFPSLLAQPRPRLETWQMKIGLLAVAIASVAAAAVFSWWLWAHTIWAHTTEFEYAVELWPVHIPFILLLALLAFASGLWTKLLLRQTATAFWCAILVPLLLYRAAWPIMDWLSDDRDVSFTMAALAVLTCGYAAVGYSLARWLFLHAQDKQAQETTDSAAWSFLPAFPKPRYPVAALLVKELRLQQGTLVIAVVLAVLHLAALAAARYWPRVVAPESPLPHLIWMLWWVAPFLVGCASVAEERRSRTLESTLCLPVGRLRQFAIKMLVVFGLGLFLGAVMPWALEKAPFAAVSNLNAISELGLPSLLLTSAIITAIGCYASSLSSTLLQALGATLVFALLVPVAAFWAGFYLPLCWPVLIPISLCLSYANFKQLRITWRLWLRNGILWLAVIFAMKILLLIMGGILDWIIFPLLRK